MITDVARNQLQRDTERIVQSLQPEAASCPALVVLVGLPATGKTHLATKLTERSGAVVLESDAIRSMLVSERRYTKAENRRVFAAIHAAIDTLLAQPAQVILDATSLTERDRAPLYGLADRHGAALVMVHVVAPDEMARERLERRTGETTHSEADRSVYDKMQWRIEAIRRPHVTVDTSKSIEPALDALIKEITQP